MQHILSLRTVLLKCLLTAAAEDFADGDQTAVFEVRAGEVVSLETEGLEEAMKLVDEAARAAEEEMNQEAEEGAAA